jgi:hypothetical protein
MKTSGYFQLSIIFLFVMLLAGCGPSKKLSQIAPKFPCEGVWDGTVSDTPYGDVRGDLQLYNESVVLKGLLITSLTGRQEVKDLALNGNVITGYIEALGTVISIKGTVEGDKITGTASADGYDFPYNANRRPVEEKK